MAEFQEVQVLDEKKAVRDGLIQIRGMFVAIKAKVADFAALRDKWVAGVGTDYSQSDANRLNAILNAWANAPANPKSIADMIDVFLASNLGK